MSDVINQPRLPPGPGAQVAHLIRSRMQSVLNGVQDRLRGAEHSTQFLTQAQQQMLSAAPEEMRQPLIQRFQRENQGRLQGMRNLANVVDRPFSPLETSSNIQHEARALRSSVDQSFAAFERYARSLPPEQRTQVMSQLATERARLSQSLEPQLAQLTRSGASLQDVQSALQRIDAAIGMSVGYMADQLLQAVPPETRPLAQAEFQLLQEGQALAKYNLFSRALQPSSPTDFSKLPGNVPTTGALTPTQTHQTMGRFEASIQQQYQMRMEQANKLPAELRDAAAYDAGAQRDRLLVTAYRNVLGRMVDPLQPPPAPATR
jgi:hypothetical protein